MSGNPRPIAREAARRFPVRVIVAVPPGGFGKSFDRMEAWLNENCGADSWMITPVGDRRRAVPVDTVAVYLPDAALTAAFVARWCTGEDGGVHQVRDDNRPRACRRRRTSLVPREKVCAPGPGV